MAYICYLNIVYTCITALPDPLPPRPLPKGCLLGPKSSSWERGTLLSCYDVLHLFGPQMRLLPRFGLQDLHDGLSTTNENELVTTVCFVLFVFPCLFFG